MGMLLKVNLKMIRLTGFANLLAKMDRPMKDSGVEV